MDKSTIFSKTARGINELKSGARSLSRDQSKALAMVNGKSSLSDFFPALTDIEPQKFLAALTELERLGLIRVFVDLTPPAGTAPAAGVTARGAGSASNDLPVLEAVELAGEESVQAWAEAKRGASALQETGFYTYNKKEEVSETGEKRALTVLVVEDDEAIAQLLELLLSNRGFIVRKAADIPAAITMLKDGAPPDLVLLDVVLPGAQGQDGFHILRLIRQTIALRRLPVIMVTSQISDTQVMQGLKDGADGYIFKPFKWDALYSCIKSVVGL